MPIFSTASAAPPKPGVYALSTRPHPSSFLAAAVTATEIAVNRPGELHTKIRGKWLRICRFGIGFCVNAEQNVFGNRVD